MGDRSGTMLTPNGIPETMSIDHTMHSLFGASKVAADVLVQEYGRYFGMKTACFRGGCLTGPNHSGTQLHGFLAYLMKCAVTEAPYTIFGYKSKQVRDNIHSNDLIRAFHAFYKNPRCGEVYNMGGGRFSNCSMLEAIDAVRADRRQRLSLDAYVEQNRRGDHIWWIGDLARFQSHYPDWKQQIRCARNSAGDLRQERRTLEAASVIHAGKVNVLGVLHRCRRLRRRHRLRRQAPRRKAAAHRFRLSRFTG